MLAALLILATLAAYWQVCGLGFTTFDDDKYVTANANVLSGLSARSICWAFTRAYIANWHPLTWMSHMLDCQMYGLKPAGHHITSLAFHLLNVLLLFIIFNRMTKSVWRSAFLAALFGLHPIHVESVAWIAERKDVLSTFFWMLATLAYVYYTECRNAKRYLLVCASFALGLMAKPMLVTMPLTLLMLDYWPLKRSRALSQLLIEKIPLLSSQRLPVLSRLWFSVRRARLARSKTLRWAFDFQMRLCVRELHSQDALAGESCGVLSLSATPCRSGWLLEPRLCWSVCLQQPFG